MIFGPFEFAICSFRGTHEVQRVTVFEPGKIIALEECFGKSDLRFNVNVVGKMGDERKVTLFDYFQSEADCSQSILVGLSDRVVKISRCGSVGTCHVYFQNPSRRFRLVNLGC